jgi:DNA invertase Pin-like site-specific DNA recombinase
MPQVPPLTDAQRREIVRLRAMGRQYKEIARKLGCTPDQVRRWLRCRSDGGETERRLSRESARRRRAAKKSPMVVKTWPPVNKSQNFKPRYGWVAQEAARQALASEVLEARAERNTAPLLRTWPEGTWK